MIGDFSLLTTFSGSLLYLDLSGERYHACVVPLCLV
jgi:uncharacterized membrane protein YgdD (TMEM256/DUF423 family)